MDLASNYESRSQISYCYCVDLCLPVLDAAFPDRIILMKWNIAAVTHALVEGAVTPAGTYEIHPAEDERPLKPVRGLVFTLQYHQYTTDISTQHLWPERHRRGGGLMSAAPVLDNNH